MNTIRIIDFRLPLEKPDEIEATLNLDAKVQDFINRKNLLSPKLAEIVAAKNDIIISINKQNEELPHYMQNYFILTAGTAAESELLLSEFEAQLSEIKTKAASLVALCNSSMEEQSKYARQAKLDGEAAVLGLRERHAAELEETRKSMMLKYDGEILVLNEENKSLIEKHQIELARLGETHKEGLENAELKWKNRFDIVDAERKKWHGMYLKKGRGK